ncbi:MAG: hypothetical protein QM723_35210 [Myxococcaceae bacterium]
MADPVFQRPLALAAPVAVERAVKYLTRQGYSVSAQSTLEASLVHTGGVAPAPPRHGVKVTADGQSVSVSYLRASIFDTPPSQAELTRFERVVDQLAAAVGAGPAEAPVPRGPTPNFCPECGTRTEAGSSVCAICGAKF